MAGAVVTAWVNTGLGAACTDTSQPIAASPSPRHKTPHQSQLERQQSISAPSLALGVNDLGIWSDLDSKISIQAPALSGRGLLLWHPEKALVIVYDGIGKDAQAVKIYPVVDGAVDGAQSLHFKQDSDLTWRSTSPSRLKRSNKRFNKRSNKRFNKRSNKQQSGKPASNDASTLLWFRPRDAAELKALINNHLNSPPNSPPNNPISFRKLSPGEPVPGGDADDDGIPNSLDILIGANKTALNRARYGAGYIRIKYPNGDVPRDVGVCTDVVIRATRNAGIDLQSALYKDIAAAKRFYPMIRKRNRHIDHRRVKTLLPYFIRHWDLRSPAIDEPNDPLRPGDVIFFDTFPNRKGPDHIGIVSATIGASGHPLIINNWTDGAVTQEMDLLSFVPVTHRFRVVSQ